MKKIPNKILETYEHDGFIIETADGGGCYDAWLYHKDYGVKDYMFGLFASQWSYKAFLNTIEEELESHIVKYKEEHM